MEKYIKDKTYLLWLQQKEIIESLYQLYIRVSPSTLYQRNASSLMMDGTGAVTF